MNFYADSNEWKWLFKNAIDWKKIIHLYHKEFPTSEGIKNTEEMILYYEELFSSIGDWCGNSLANKASELDKVGAGTVKDGRTYFSKVLEEVYCESSKIGLHGLSVYEKYGGMSAPMCLTALAFGMIGRACQSSCSQLGFFPMMVDMLERFCSKEIKERLIPELITGKISGSMCLTEANAGSDIGSLTTSAVKSSDETYLLNGTKIFITNGGGDFGFVLARIKGAPEGLSGISLFLVERDLPDGSLNYRVIKNEEKLGQKGAFSCQVVYQDSIGTIVGEENSGFKIMLYLMNLARVGVGMQAAGGMEAVISYVKDYAENREQFGKKLVDLPLYKKNLEDLEVESDAFRALMFDTISHYEIYQNLDLKKRATGELNENETKEFQEAFKWVRRRTPLVKYYGTETYAKIALKGVQALGGYGYMKDYQAERYLRDSIGGLLYEGTGQMQSLMALKDLMKYILKNPGTFFQNLIYSHPIGGIFNDGNSCQKEFLKIQYDFKKNFAGLLMKIFMPSGGELTDLIKSKKLIKDEKIDELLPHAENVCEGLAYLETLRVLSAHTKKDFSRTKLFENYKNLIRPRMAKIFESFKI